MSNITIFVGSATPANNKIQMDGQVFVSPNSGPYSWSCEHGWDEIAVNINSMIKDSAIAAAVANGHTIHDTDKKTLLCGAADV